MKLCFLTISVMTPLYHGIASRLEREGHEVCWISPSARWSRYLTERGVKDEVVLDLTRFADEWGSDGRRDDRSALTAFESRASKSVRDLILMDRLMSHRPEDTVLDYADAAVRHAGRFLADQDAKVVFAEPSYLLAYIVAELAQQHGIAVYNIDTVRFPDGRFGLFEGMYQETLVGSAPVTDEDRGVAVASHERFLEEHSRPAYFYANLRKPEVGPVLAWKFLRNLRRQLSDPHDESAFDVRRMTTDHIARAWNHLSVRRWDGLVREPSSDRPYVLYGMHKQPELGIDVWASYLSNQGELLRTIARSIPITHDLYIKAHGNDLGGRSRAFFKQLAEIPGVRIIDPLADSHALIRGADLVLSVTGSMAFEAGLYGRRAIAYAPMFFAPLLAASGVDPYAMRKRDVAEILARPHPADDPGAFSRVEFLAWVHAQSYPGIVGDPLTDPRIMVEANLDLVGHGFTRFLATRHG